MTLTLLATVAAAASGAAGLGLITAWLIDRRQGSAAEAVAAEAAPPAAMVTTADAATVRAVPIPVNLEARMD